MFTAAPSNLMYSAPTRQIVICVYCGPSNMMCSAPAGRGGQLYMFTAKTSKCCKIAELFRCTANHKKKILLYCISQRQQKFPCRYNVLFCVCPYACNGIRNIVVAILQRMTTRKTTSCYCAPDGPSELSGAQSA